MLDVPVRGVDAGYRKQTSCHSHFAIVTVDFEPADEYEFLDVSSGPSPTRKEWMSDETWAGILRSHDEDLHFYKEVFAEAMRTEIGALPIAVMLTRFGYHEVDSSDCGFVAAARRAVRELHRRVPVRLAEPVRGLHARHAGTYVNGETHLADVTVDFEPAEAYEFVDGTGLPDEHVAALAETVQDELCDPPVRMILTDGRCRHTSMFGFRDLAFPLMRELRKHL